MTPLVITPEVAQKICQSVGLRMTSSNDSHLAEWVHARCQERHLPSPEAYGSWLADPLHALQEREALSKLLTSHETYFLRDRGALDVLREHILKDTLAQKKEQRSLNIWSVGCSTGEEPYTLSILLEENMSDLGQWQVDILGSDIDSAVLTQARQAVYRPWSFRGCPPEFITRYFHADNGYLKLMAHIMDRVRFERLDIVGDVYPTSVKGMAHADIILCRNVFIYLDDAAIQTALKKITACLNEGGYLLCGPGELQAQAHPQLVPRIFPQAMVFQKKTIADQPVVAEPSHTLAPHATPYVTQHTAAQTLPFTPAEPTTTLAHAWALANRGDVAQASAMCDTLIQQHPFDPHAHYLHAVLLFAQGLSGQARESLRRVLYLDPLFAVAYLMLSDVCMAIDDITCALKSCEQGLKATSIQAEEQRVPYFKSVTYLEFRQHLQDRIVSLAQ